MILTSRGTRRGSVYFIIRWIEQRGMSTYNIGWVCV